MGNSNESQNRLPDADFPMQKYVNKGLSPSAVIKIKEAFDSYEPVDGYIDVEKVKDLSKDSGDKKMIDREIGNKTKLNFDEFFAMSADILRDKIKAHPDIEIDSKEVQATCLFCPYASDDRK